MRRSYVIIALLFLFHLFLLVNLRFTAWPEMLSYPYLFNHGFKLYTDFVAPYPPFLIVLLASLFDLFGYQIWALKALTWILVLSNDLLIVLVVKQLTKQKWAPVVALVFYLLAQPFLEGNMLWFDLAIVTPLLAGLYLIMKRQYVLCGLSLALAALIKQTAGLFILFPVIYLVLIKKDLKNAFRLLICPVILLVMLLFYLGVNNSLVDFINWVLLYPAVYWSNFPGYVQMALPKLQIGRLLILFLPLVVLLVKTGKKIFQSEKLFMVLGFELLALVVVYPRWSFFHFQAALAFLAIILALTYEVCNPRLIFLNVYWLVILGLVVIPGLRKDWRGEMRFYDQNDIGLVENIFGRTGDGERILLVNLPSSYYVFTNTLPPKPWLDNFGWYYEMPGVQRKALARWEMEFPDKIIWQEPMKGNWFDLGVYQPELVTGWIKGNYLRQTEIQKGIWVWERKS